MFVWILLTKYASHKKYIENEGCERSRFSATNVPKFCSCCWISRGYVKTAILALRKDVRMLVQKFRLASENVCKFSAVTFFSTELNIIFLDNDQKTRIAIYAMLYIYPCTSKCTLIVHYQNKQTNDWRGIALVRCFIDSVLTLENIKS